MNRKSFSQDGFFLAFTAISFGLVAFLLTRADAVFARIDRDTGDVLWILAHAQESCRLLASGSISWMDLLRRSIYIPDFYFPFGRYFTGFDLDLSILLALPFVSCGGAGPPAVSIAFNVPLSIHAALDVCVLFLLLRKGLGIRFWISAAAAWLPLGFIYFAIVIRMGHLAFVAYWPALLVVWSSVQMLGAARVRAGMAVLTGFSLLLLVFANLQYAYFLFLLAVVLYPCFVAVTTLLRPPMERVPYLKTVFLNSVAAFATAAFPTWILGLHRTGYPDWYSGLLSASRIDQRPFHDLDLYAADLSRIVTPESMVYLGWPLLGLLGVLGISCLRQPAADPLAAGIRRAFQPVAGAHPVLLALLAMGALAGLVHPGTRYETLVGFTVAALAFLIFRLAQLPPAGGSLTFRAQLLLAAALLIVGGVLLATATSHELGKRLLYALSSRARVYQRTIGLVIPLFILWIAALTDLALPRRPAVSWGGRAAAAVAFAGVAWLFLADMHSTWLPYYPLHAVRPLFTAAHEYLRTKPRGSGGIADFSGPRWVAFGAYHGMMAAAYTGVPHTATPDCTDPRFLHTFYTYGGKYIVFDKSSTCGTTLLQANPDFVHPLVTFTDGSGILHLSRTAPRVPWQYDPSARPADGAVLGLPSPVLTDQALYPILVAGGRLFPPGAASRPVTVHYRWLSNTGLPFHEQSVRKPLEENPLFYYFDGRNTYLWLVGPEIYRALQPNHGIGISSPADAGGYDLEISIRLPGPAVARTFRAPVTVAATIP